MTRQKLPVLFLLLFSILWLPTTTSLTSNESAPEHENLSESGIIEQTLQKFFSALAARQEIATDIAIEANQDIHKRKLDSEKEVVRVALMSDQVTVVEAFFLKMVADWSLRNLFAKGLGDGPATSNRTRELLQWAQDNLSITFDSYTGFGLKQNAKNAVSVCLSTTKYHAVLGPLAYVDSVVAISSAVMSVYDLPQIGFTSSSPKMSNKDDYPNFSRINPSYTATGEGLAKLVLHFGWKRIVFLTKNDDNGIAGTASFVKALANTGVEIKYKQLIDSFTDTALDSMFEYIHSLNVKVIVGLFQLEFVEILLSANRTGMLDPSFVWVTTDYPLTGSIQYIFQRDNLSSADTLLAGMIGAGLPRGYGPLYTQNFLPGLMSLLKSLGVNIEEKDLPTVVAYMADSIATLVLAAADLRSQNIPLTNGTLFIDAIRRQSFEGFTGSIGFDQNGDQVDSVLEIFNFQLEKGPVSVGYITPTNFILSKDPLWRNNLYSVPPDRAPLTQNNINYAAVITIFFISTSIILLSIVAFIIISKQKNIIVIQHSGYIYLALILIGTITMISSIFISGIDLQFISMNRGNSLCMLQMWFIGIGFILLFGSFFAKSLRILMLTLDDNLKKVFNLDKKMMLFISCLLTGEIIILILWTTIDPLKLDAIYLDDMLSVTYYCRSGNALTFPLLFIIYKGTLLIAGIIVAIMSRNVENRFNESRLIGFSIYNVFILSAVIIPLTFLIDDNPTFTFVIRACGIIGISFVSPLMLFGNMFYVILLGKLVSVNQTSMSTQSVKT